MIVTATSNLYPQVTRFDEKYGCFDSNGNEVEIDDVLVAKEVERLQAEYDAQEYARNRQPLYPAIGDQLDDLYHAGVFSAEMIAKLKKVKDDNPK